MTQDKYLSLLEYQPITSAHKYFCVQWFYKIYISMCLANTTIVEVSISTITKCCFLWEGGSFTLQLFSWCLYPKWLIVDWAKQGLCEVKGPGQGLSPLQVHDGVSVSPAATRAKMTMINSMSKIRGQDKGPGYTQAETLLGETMQKYGRELGDESNFGKTQSSLTRLRTPSQWGSTDSCLLSVCSLFSVGPLKIVGLLFKAHEPSPQAWVVTSTTPHCDTHSPISHA